MRNRRTVVILTVLLVISIGTRLFRRDNYVKLLPFRSTYSEHWFFGKSAPSSAIFFCNANQSVKQGESYKKELMKSHSWAGCYADDYVLKLYLADIGTAREKRKLLFDVGSNKGYVLATWQSIWAPNSGVNPKSLGKYLSEELSLNQCGFCNDCNESSLIDKLNWSRNLDVSLKIHAFEPQPSMYETLDLVRKWMNCTYLHLHNLAVSNHTGTALLSKCVRGAEACGLATHNVEGNLKEYVSVNVTTLDTFVQQNSITDLIDILKIDTEGFDPLVLRGADLILTRQQVRLLIFEHHEVGFWRDTHLRNVVDDLDAKGYTCYMLGKTGIIRMTKCWSTAFEKKQWSNVLCVRRTDERLKNYIQQLLLPFTV